MNQFAQLRRDYPKFIYHGYQLSLSDAAVQMSWDFEIVGLTRFQPRVSIPLHGNMAVYDPLSPVAHRLVFYMGMVELVSYWKATCSPHVIVAAGDLTPGEVEWWKDLYFGGLGEFFYLNGIDADRETFMDMRVVSEAPVPGGVGSAVESAHIADGIKLPTRQYQSEGDDILYNFKLCPTPADWHSRNRRLIPVGGGKDSVVTMERMKSSQADQFTFGINPTQAALDCMTMAGFEDNHRILVKRTLDQRLLDLNTQGFLNGHTPFSAVVAFTALFVAYLSGADAIILSNEASADESSVPGTAINHQFSKTSTFEVAFQSYCETEIGLPIRYFSLLRPFNELCIAREFARYERYFPIFRSCNVGSKKNIWCGRCAKCLFIALMLAPFVGLDRLAAIFGKEILDDVTLEAIFDELTGAVPVKAFECVGTVQEVRFAANRLLRHWHPRRNDLPTDLTGDRSIPALLARYLDQCRNALFPDVLLDRDGFPYNSVGRDHPLVAFHSHRVPGEFLPFIEGMNRPELTDFLAGKRILLLGYGREGKAALTWLYYHYEEINPAAVGVADLRDISLNAKLIQLLDVAVFTGPDYLTAIEHYDVILKSPGIS
ncbi:MAG TPA: hypothetical protein GX717_00705, partial [Clostridiaceae bacterium]|nr:hypothetical protein [Clostridiaceae bacterium]